MITLTAKEKEILVRAGEIEIKYLEAIAQNKTQINNIKELLRHPDFFNQKLPDEELEICITTLEVIRVFEKFIEDPCQLDQMNLRNIEMIGLILVEHFEDQWETETADDVEFAALCYKICNLSDKIELNQHQTKYN